MLNTYEGVPPLAVRVEVGYGCPMMVSGSVAGLIATAVAGSSKSMLFRARRVPVPPTIAARPSSRRIAVAPSRIETIEPAGTKVPLVPFGTYRSSDARPCQGWLQHESLPPATRTEWSLSFRRTAVWS